VYFFSLSGKKSNKRHKTLHKNTKKKYKKDWKNKKYIYINGKNNENIIEVWIEHIK
jgi:hypothetical protein